MSAEDFLASAPGWVRDRASGIRTAKGDGRRLRPSASLIDQSALLTAESRGHLLDAVASLVDENLAEVVEIPGVLAYGAAAELLSISFNAA